MPNCPPIDHWASRVHLCSIGKPNGVRYRPHRVVGMTVDADKTDDPLLRVDGVRVSFGGLDVLSDVSIDVPASGVLGVIGPNGAGKTTLFNVICGFVRPTKGSMTFRSRPLRRHRPHDVATLGIARTLQGLGLFNRLTVLDNVMAGTTHLSRTT